MRTAEVLPWYIAAMAVGLFLICLHHFLTVGRAEECSAMLHGTVEASSVEVGACLLQYDQPLTTGDE